MRPAYDPKMSEFDPDSIGRMKERLAHAEPSRASASTSVPTPAPPQPNEPASAKPELAVKDDAPSELREGDREVWRRAADLANAGDAQGAWFAARPLFPAYPLVYGVQDLRCKLAMARLGSYDEVRKECDPLMALSMKGGAAK